jgi:hypothetical protein
VGGMHGKWKGDYAEEYTDKIRPSYATPLAQLIIHYMLKSWKNAPYARWMPHHSIDLPHVDL